MPEKKLYCIFDLSKFIMSFMIMALHALIVPDFLMPAVRTAVPLYFIISSFLLFERKASGGDVGGILKKYVVRNMKLYLFWTIALFPFVIIYNVWHTIPFPRVIFHIVTDLMFSSFPASWFIPASVIATALIFYIPKKYNYTLLAASFAIYLICCVDSNYYYLFPSGSFIIQFVRSFKFIVNDPRVSFLVAFMWVSVGKLFAENKIFIRPVLRWGGMAVSAVLLWAEHAFVTVHGIFREHDCYLFLVPFCFFIFSELKELSWINIKYTATLRKMSTLIYCIHHSAVLGFRGVFRLFLNTENPYLVFTCALCATLAVGFAILKLESHRGLSWLKYSH